MSVLQQIERRTDLDDREKRYRCGVTREILELKEAVNATILVHNYQIDEIQDIADLSGDSLALARQAIEIDSDVIVLCGVQFMAESAAILNPEKTVLLPEKEAGCPMADMVTVESLREMKKEHPDAAVMCYVNSSAEVKAESDICCTSSNAVKVANSLEEDRIIFVPDQNLGRWVARHTDKEIILWKGFCVTHHRLEASEVVEARKEHPGAKVIAHPECKIEVLDIADAVCSTQGMFDYAKQSDSREFIICTEMGMLYKLHKLNPGRKFFIPSESLICPNMKLTTLDSVRNSLKNMVHRITIAPEIREPAKLALKRMLAVT